MHDASRCLYCRQPLNDLAKDLVRKYGDYLTDKISMDIKAINSTVDGMIQPLRTVDFIEVATFVKEYREREDQPSFYNSLVQLENFLGVVQGAVRLNGAAPNDLDIRLAPVATELGTAVTAASSELVTLQEQASNRVATLNEKKNDLNELIAAAELSKSWSLIQGQVHNAKEVNKLTILARAVPNLGRSVTELSKVASDQLINQNFDKLFIEECQALRAPNLKLQFVGRQGKAQRRKVLSGKYKPSKVLSEGEQKVLALADFLAEARLAGITAPVVFDDPVSSLDHRRINEVAQRVAYLAEDTQVIVFTHDIFFATTLLTLFEKSKRCAYFQVTDEDGKGKITRATGPRWDTLNSIKKNIN